MLKKRKVAPKNSIDIASSIEDGTYYNKAVEWYLFKFCRPLSDRIYWFVILAIYSLAVLILYTQIKSWYPLKVSRPIVLVNEDSRFKQVVMKMKNPYQNADLALLDYLLGNYVKMREEYLQGSLDLLEIDNRLKKVANNSTREITKEYQKIFDGNDQTNPIKRLGKSGSRKVAILSTDLGIKEFTFFENLMRINRLIEMPKDAKIRYMVKEVSARRNKQELWEAHISFNYTGVIIDKDINKIIINEFTVTDYKNNKITK